MNTTFHYIAWVLVFVAIFSTVAPALVLATDTAQITNNARAVSDTGGQNGADGEDGRDGAPGQDGEDGEDGANVSTGNSSASAHIQTTIDGTTVTDIQKDVTATGSAAASVHTSTTLPDEAVATETASGAASLPANELSRIQQVLSSIRTILLHYVETLF